MSLKSLELRVDALLIADAHYGTRRPELLPFLQQIEQGDVATTQLILMGDIFDLLFGPIPITCERNAEAVQIIRRIASKMEVIYLEGNHDFQLTSLFPQIHVVPREQQPITAVFEDQQIRLAHGDWDGGTGYRWYTAFIRSRGLLNVLRWIDTLTGHAIIQWLDRYLQKKEDCHHFDDFEAYTRRRFEGMDVEKTDLFIEGHFHQNRSFFIGPMRYVNLAAFACNQRYYALQSIAEPLKEGVFDKES